MSVAFPVTTIGQHLNRVQALAAMLESVLPGLAPDASSHDFTIDDEVYNGLGMIANVMREDLDSAQAVLRATELDRPAPWDLRSEGEPAAERGARDGAR